MKTTNIISPFFDKNNRKLIVRLYSDWCKNNVSAWTSYIQIIGILSMGILIPFDFLLFNGYFYPSARAIIISLLTCIFVLSQMFKTKRINQKRDELSILLTVLLLEGFYLFFLVNAPDSERNIVLIGTALVLIFSNIAMYRFWRPQIIFTVISIAALIALSFTAQLKNEVVLLMITHTISATFSIFFRRVFAFSLCEKFLLMKSMVPEQIANYITTSSENAALDQAFPMKNRMVACVCCDWRGYQELAGKTNPLELAKLQEVFYDLVFEQIQTIDPTGSYFVNWTADELFVVFYDPENDLNVADKAFNFCLTLQSNIFSKIQKISNRSIMYDIGLSLGVGALGIQGPKFFKKTTITGAVAGLAKRFETEAKTLRSEKYYSAPIIVTTAELMTQYTNPKPIACLEPITGKTKDTLNMKLIAVFSSINKSAIESA